MNAHSDITAAPADELVKAVPARAAAALAATLAGPGEPLGPLSVVLARRNVLVDEVNALALTTPEPPQEALDAITDRYGPLEDALRDATPATIDDFVAKVAWAAELVREHVCLNREDAERLIVDAQSILADACNPLRPAHVERRDAHWALVPTAAGRSPSAALQAIIAVANDYSEKFVVPADKAHSSADRAYVENENDENNERLSKAQNEAWQAWDAHCDTYREIVDQILELRAGSAQELLAQVETYCDLLAAHWAANPKAPTKLAKLGETDVELVAEHMHTGLKRLAYGSAQTDAALDVATIVAEATEFAKEVASAQAAFNAADSEWVDAKDAERSADLTARRDELESAWWERLDRYFAMAARIFQLPAASPAERLGHVATYADLVSPIAGDPGYSSKLESLPRDHLVTVINYLAGAMPPISQGAAWAKAVAEHTAAKGAYDNLTAPDREEFDEMHDIIDPACRAPGLHYANSTRWTMEQDFENEILLTAGVKDMLRGRVLASIEARHQLLKSYPPEREARAELLEALSDEAYAARKLLLATPAPDAAGVLLKQEVRVYEVDDDKLGVTDPAYVSFALHDYVDHAYPVQTYLDLLTVAGRVYHTPEAIDFNPRVWIRDYEATGAKVSQVNTMLILTYPDENDAAAGALRDQLAAAPWKYRAVQLAAEARRLEGGDPFYDAGGNSGHRDRRHSERRFHGHIARADNIAFSVVDGRAVPHVEHIDNREKPYIPAAFGVRAEAEAGQ